MVLPYCIINVGIYFLIDWLHEKEHIRIDVSEQGHSLMSLIIAYLGVSKVNIALKRYMDSKQTVETAVLSLREVNQVAMIISENDKSAEARTWRQEVKIRIVALVEMTIKVIQDTDHAKYLAMARIPPQGITPEMTQDPMSLAYKLRSTLITSSKVRLKNDLQVLERMKMVDYLLQYSVAYRELLKIVSTPFPLALTQLARTFIFVWTLSIPFVLTGGKVERWSAIVFVVVLTYGFMGLEFVAMKMSNPFGKDWHNDLQVHKIAKAAIIGIENDWKSTEGGRSGGMDTSMMPERGPSLLMAKGISNQTLSTYENNSLRTAELYGIQDEPSSCYAAYPICFCGDDEFS